MVKWLYSLVFGVGAIALGSCDHIAARRQLTDVANLPQAFPILETYQVAAYRNQDWCQNIAYRRGQFSNEPDISTCNLFKGQPKPFDAAAQQDFEKVAQAITETGVNILYITNLEYDEAGALTQAEFHLQGTFNRRSYVYHPGYPSLPTDIPNERSHLAISDDWYAVRGDWN